MISILVPIFHCTHGLCLWAFYSAIWLYDKPLVIRHNSSLFSVDKHDVFVVTSCCNWFLCALGETPGQALPVGEASILALHTLWWRRRRYRSIPRFVRSGPRVCCVHWPPCLCSVRHCAEGMNGFYTKLIQVLCFFRVREVDDAGNGRCFPHPFVWKADPGILVRCALHW